MRRQFKVCAAVGVALTWSATAPASDLDEQLREMQERMSELESKLEATDAELQATSEDLEASKAVVEEQAKVMERAGIETEESSSGISSFFEKVEVSGWVQASYWYNFNHLPGGPSEGINFIGDANGNAANVGSFGFANPFNPDTDTFQVDQVWFEIYKPATEESRGGFALDLVMGKTADVLGSPSGSNFRSPLARPGNGDNMHVYQAYVEYLAPIGPGLKIQAGRFGTVIGYEVAQAVYNANVSRGLLYSVLQPFNQDGVLATMDFDNGISVGAGVLNNAIGTTNTDLDSEKVFMWKLGYSADSWGLSFNGLYGGDIATDNEPVADQLANCGGVTGGICNTTDNLGIINFVGTWDPTEKLSLWGDLMFNFVDGDSGALDQYAFGLSLGGRYAITEKTGLALRGEYIYSNDNFLAVPTGATDDQNLWSLTATVDHQLADGLKVRGEVRYEQGTNSVGSNAVFYSNSVAGFQSDQVLVGLDVIYQF